MKTKQEGWNDKLCSLDNGPLHCSFHEYLSLNAFYQVLFRRYTPRYGHGNYMLYLLKL